MSSIIGVCVTLLLTFVHSVSNMEQRIPTAFPFFSFIQMEGIAESLVADQSMVEAYESHLLKLRSKTRLRPNLIRIEHLGLRLWQQSLEQVHESDYTFENGLTSLWTDEILAQIMHQRTPEDCTHFYEYFEAKFRPRLFDWTIHSIMANQLEQMYIDPYWHDLWSNALYSYDRFVHGYTPKLSIAIINEQPSYIGYESVHHVHCVFVLYQTIQLLPSDFKQIVEFGAGTGHNVILLQDMGFSGVHFVLDLPPMLLLQQYFIKYSGYSAYLGINVPPHDSLQHKSGNVDGVPLQGRKVLLESSLSSDNYSSFQNHFDSQLVDQTLFYATFSLSEATLPHCTPLHRCSQWCPHMEHYFFSLTPFTTRRLIC